MSDTEQTLGTRDLTADRQADDPAAPREHSTPTAHEEDHATTAAPSDHGTRARAADDAPASTGEFADGGPRDAHGDDDATLLPEQDNAGFRSRWEEIQTGFVDEPRRTVEQADELVAQVMQRLAEGFAAEREGLEAEWGRGEDVSTEDLRVALQRYRSFFRRMLSA